MLWLGSVAEQPLKLTNVSPSATELRLHEAVAPQPGCKDGIITVINY